MSIWKHFQTSFKNIGRALVFACPLFVTWGCADVDLRGVSSGQIGCSPADIRVSNDEMGWGTRTWTADCGGKRYFCSAVRVGRDDQVNCTGRRG